MQSEPFEEEEEEQQIEGAQPTISDKVLKTIKKNKAAIVVGAASAALSLSVIVAQNKLIHKHQESITELSNEIESQKQQQCEMQEKMSQMEQEMNETKQTNQSLSENAASNGFYGGLVGTTVAVVTRTAIGLMFGV